MIYDGDDKTRRFRMIGRMVLVRIVFAIIIAEAVMILWNMLLPDLIHVNPVNYWQALGLLALVRLLTGRGGGGFGGPMGGGRWRGRWQQMTAEERDAFREEWKKRKC